MRIKALATVIAAALLALLTAAVPAGAATRTSPTVPGAEAQAACTTPTLYGLHGVNEDETSPTIQETFQAFYTHAEELGHGYWFYESIPYPTDYTSIWTVLADATSAIFAGYSDLQGDADELQTHILDVLDTCPSGTFSFVGYSEGAWIINIWLQEHPDEWKYVRAVELYGDPCWYDPYESGAYQGLARIVQSAGIQMDCGPAQGYPWSSAPFKVQSLCNYGDPVCGQGYADTLAEHPVQLADALNCTEADQCTHLDYQDGGPASGATNEGGEFLAENAFS
jgi:Cutinase